MPNITLKQIGAASKYLVVVAAVLVFIGWFLNTPPGLLGKADAIGYAVCHRIAERSFHIGSYQLPLCARCLGMYLGAVTGLVFQSIFGWKRGKAPHWSVITILAIFVVAFGIDGANSYLYLLKQIQPGILSQIPNIYIPNNTLRLLTGSGMGLGIAAMLFPAFNQSVWIDVDDARAALPGWKAFGPLLGIQIILDILVLTESPFVLYPVAIISVLGVWLLLTLVYAILWVMITGQENKFKKLRQVWLPLLAGLTITIIQTAAIDMLRFWLTRTWGGFPLGQ
ncbi:MAG: DUF2085 domain-containing protein [Anaerolineales bacterium]